MIKREPVTFEEVSHTYSLKGETLLGVSTVAKIGDAMEAFGIASAWGYRIGYEGARSVLGEYIHEDYADVEAVSYDDGLRSALKARGLTPWAVRDKASDRGNWVHDVLEQLAQNGTIFFREDWTDEIKGHVRAVWAWYVDHRPSFVATEVQVASMEHGFSGRYDIRCRLYGELLLVDLKTSKRVYPTSQFAQLSGYELASVEMGFPPTDGQFVLNTHPDGTYDFVRSWSKPEDFVAYLGALRAIRRIEAEDPEHKLKLAREQAILANLPGLSRDLARTVPLLAGMDGKAVGILLSGLRKRGLVRQDSGVWSSLPGATGL